MLVGFFYFSGVKVMSDALESNNQLRLRVLVGMDEWGKIEDRIRMDGSSDELYAAALRDGEAVDAEGVEITKELKRLYGYKYLFRYSYAWNSTWVIV